MALASRFDPEGTLDLLARVTKLLHGERRVIELPEGKLLFVGDTHGDWEATQALLKRFWDSKTTFVFLGDYVDRGSHQVENINLLYELKRQAPERLVLLRGNHECESVNRNYGFYDQVQEKLGSLNNAYTGSFAELPLAATSAHYGIFAVHGGLAEKLGRVEEINRAPRAREPEDPITFQLLWNDPRDMIRGFAPNMRGGGSKVFGADVTEKFLRRNKLQLIVRGHEVFEHGYHEYHNGLVLSLFSCRSYGQPIDGKALMVDESGERQLVPV
jgi:diadenosine tetraphosphatase ApaH/serine/threonine PP2A family protein phosphatase